MGSTTGTYSRTLQTASLFDERKLFVQVLAQAGRLVTDADWNDFQNSFYLQLRRLASELLGDGTTGIAFKPSEITPTPAINNLKFLGSYDPNKGPEILYNAGHPAKLFEDAEYLTSAEISPRSTFLTACELGDSAAFYVADELVGRYLIPDITKSFSYEIIANTQNKITILATSDMIADGITVLQNYRVTLKEPTDGDREDLIYLDVYLDEYDIIDDPVIAHSFSGPASEETRRYKLIQTVFVREGQPLPETYTWNSTTTVTASAGPSTLAVGDRIQLDADGQYFEISVIAGPLITILNPDALLIPSGSGPTSKAGKLPTQYLNIDGEYIDANGNQHWLLPIGKILRELLNPFITDSMITDLRDVIPTASEMDARYVNVSGDTMTGNLNFQAGTELLGNLILGFEQLKDQSVGTRHFKVDEHLLGDGDIVPSLSNLPVVHDNRYFTKSTISVFFGDNLLVNPNFSKGLDIGWDNRAPLPLWGGPAELVIENANVYWMVCGTEKCCHGVETQLQPDYSGCEVTILCQEVCLCAGGLFVFQECFEVFAEGTIPEEFKVRPFIDILIFSSDLYMGKERKYFSRTIETISGPLVVDEYFYPNSGLRDLRTLFSLPRSTDKIIVILGYETEFERTSDPCCRLGERLSIVTCKTALRRFGSVGSIQDNEFEPGEESLPEVINEGASATIASSESRKIPTLDCVTETGLVKYIPGFKQKQLSIYRTNEIAGISDAAFIWGKDSSESECPQLIETICVEGLSFLKTSVGMGTFDIQCFSMSPSSFDIPDTGTTNYLVNFTGINFPTGLGDLVIEEFPAISDLDFLINNIIVNPGGTTGSFELTISDQMNAGSFIIRFTDTITTEYDDCILQLNAPAAPAPCIYDIDEDCLPSTNGITYPVNIYGRYFQPGNTSVTPDRGDIIISALSVSATTISFNLTTQVSIPTTAAIFNLSVTTPDGIDSIPVVLVPVANEFDGTNFEGSSAPTLDGTFSTITQAYYEFDNGIDPKLTIIGTNLNSVTSVDLIQVHVGDDRGSDSIVFSEQALGRISIPQGSFEVQNSSAIKLNVSSAIQPSLGKMPLAFRLVTPAQTSRAYVPGAKDQISATSATYFSDSQGTGINVDSIYNIPGALVEVTATLLGYGIRKMFLPVDSATLTSVSTHTKIPIDTAQPVSVRLFVPPYGLNTAERNGYNLTLVGPGNDTKSVSNSVVATVEATAPVIAAVLPIEVEQGQTLGLLINGVGFQSGATVSFSGTGITILGSTNVFADGTSLTVPIQVTGGASLGTRNVTVTNHPSLLSDTKTAALTVIFPEGSIVTVQDLGAGNPAPSLKYVLDSSIDGQTVIESDPITRPPALVGGFNIVPFKSNNGYIELEMEFDSGASGHFDIQFFIKDGAGQKSFATIPNTSTFATGVFLPIQLDLNADFSSSPIDLTNIAGIGWTYTNTTPGTHRIRVDNIKVITLVPAASVTLDDNFGTPYPDTGSNHVVNMGLPISLDVTPVVTKLDCIQDFSFYGDTGWELADCVLVPSTEENELAPIIPWISGNTELELNHATYRKSETPERCCHNIYIEPMYEVPSGCRSVEAELRAYDVEDPECGCVPPGGYTQVIGEMISDPLLYRILPDDGFNGTPTNYNESIEFEICVTNPTNNQCETIVLGSKQTDEQVYFAGGGRNDPNINTGGIPTHPVTGNPLYIVVHLGPGSPQGSRENLIASPITILAGSTSAVIQMSPLGLQGLAVDMDVWIMNLKDPRNNGELCMTACDVLSNSDIPQLYGIYGTITALDLGLAQVTITWTDPTLLDATFQPLWGGRVLASPEDRMGYYWEVSEGILDYIDPGYTGTVVQWNFNMWAAHAADCSNGLYSGLKECTDIQAGVLLDNGDGVTNKFRFIGSTGNVLKERDWFTLFATPTREQHLLSDGLPGSNILEVSDATRFEVCDMIEIIDDNFKPGFRTAVAAINLPLNQLILKEQIPANLPGYPSFDGFLITRCAEVFRLVTRVNCQVCVTEVSEPDGTPQNFADNQDRCVVNFEAGTFTFDPLLDACIGIWSVPAIKCYQLPNDVNGVYTFKGVNLWQVLSGWSKSISVRDNLNPVPDDTSIARDNTRPPTDHISWNNKRIEQLAPGTVGHHAVNLDQLNAAIAGIGPDTTSIARDNTRPPTADISMGSHKLTDLLAATSPGDAVRFDQLISGNAKIQVIPYTGTGVPARIISTTMTTIRGVIIVAEGLVGVQSYLAVARLITHFPGIGSIISTVGAGDSMVFVSGAITISGINIVVGHTTGPHYGNESGISHVAFVIGEP